MENKAIKGFKKAVDEAVRLRDAKNDDDAALILKKLIELVEDAEMFSSSDGEAFFCFNNMLEQVLYDEVFKPGKKLSQVPDDYAGMYHKYGALLRKAKQYDEAELILQKALCWNPVDADILFELSEVYKMRGDWEPYFFTAKQCLAFAYSKRSLARAYRGLGFYFIEQENYDLASALYLVSLYFDEKNAAAIQELSYIREKTGENPLLPVKPKEADAMLRFIADQGIQVWANPHVINIAVSLLNKALEGDMIDAVRYYLDIAYDLTGNKDMKDLIDKMDAHAEKNNKPGKG